LFGEGRNLLDRDYATFGTFTDTDQVLLKEVPGASDPRTVSTAAPRRW
jgi:iron complex outermembrane recepter protein